MFSGYKSSFPGVKWQGREVYCSPPSGAWLRIYGARLMPSWHSKGNVTVLVLALKTYLCIGFVLLQI
jgi:hypothetical protein